MMSLFCRLQIALSTLLAASLAAHLAWAEAPQRIVTIGSAVTEIAYELGFKYPQHFIRLFKKRVGHTPKEYRSIN